MGFSRFWLKVAVKENKSIVHDFSRSLEKRATARSVLDRVLPVGDIVDVQIACKGRKYSFMDTEQRKLTVIFAPFT